MAGPHPGVSRVHVQAPAGDDEAEPTFVYEADFHIAGHPGLNHNSIYVGPLHPWLTSIERSDGMLHPFGLSEDAFEGRLAPVKAWLDGGGHTSIVRPQSFIPCSPCAEKTKSDSERDL